VLENRIYESVSTVLAGSQSMAMERLHASAGGDYDRSSPTRRRRNMRSISSRRRSGDRALTSRAASILQNPSRSSRRSRLAQASDGRLARSRALHRVRALRDVASSSAGSRSPRRVCEARTVAKLREPATSFVGDDQNRAHRDSAFHREPRARRTAVHALL
jgi:hypothetical protein